LLNIFEKMNTIQDQYYQQKIEIEEKIVYSLKEKIVINENKTDVLNFLNDLLMSDKNTICLDLNLEKFL